ncbi:MAG: metal-sensing transcriptional repressor [Actinomycetota bacterium]|nr:metal-sensing transcriptional repressor [Actinomycetota bacterium]
MELSAEAVTDARARLRRAAGQVLAVERMLSEGKECREFLPQLSAANKAIEQAGLRLLAAGYAWCLEHPEEAKAGGYPREVMERMFMKLG